MNYEYMRARLCELFDYFGLTQEQFGDRCGLTQSTITPLLAGRRRPQLETLVKVCHAFQLNISYFVQELLQSDRSRGG